MKRAIYGVLAVFLCIGFFPAGAQAAVISADQEFSGDIDFSEQTIVQPGVTLTISKGSKITFSQGVFLDIEGGLDIRGTVLDPVMIKGENDDAEYAIRAVNSGNIKINNADISGGGKVTSYPTNPDTGITPPDSYLGAVSAVGSGKVEVQATGFHDNEVAVLGSLTNASEGRLIVQRSSLYDNDRYDVANENSQLRHNFNYNWWGDTDGPDASKIVGNLDTEFIRDAKSFKDPVVIVHGILGSQEALGVRLIDPVFQTYDNLIEAFVASDYQKSEDLFLFTYDWNKSNIYSANNLRDKINEIKQQNNWPKVDIVAHSMGGLVARQYIESDQYTDDIDQLITLGTPHNGSPASYLTWVGGRIQNDDKTKERIFEKIFGLLAIERGQTVFEYIKSFPVESVKELLPGYSYLKDKDQSELRQYPNNYPFNDFIDSLNQANKLQKLKKVDFTNIVGKLALQDTISTIRLESESGNNPDSTEWGYGKPENYDDLETDRGLERGEGDGTVPLYSSESIASDTKIILNSRHDGLPTDAQKDVIGTLTGNRPNSEIRMPVIEKMFLIEVFSPIDIQIVSPSGKKIGKNFSNGEIYDQIPGAFYTGFETESEFITIPNPEEGEYKILTEGVGSGEYRIESVLLKDNGPGEEASESKVTFTGTAVPGEQKEEVVEVIDDTVVPAEEDDTVAPTIAIASPENKSYPNNLAVPVTFTVTDDISAPESISKEALLDGQVYSQGAIDLSLLALGAHTLTVNATDEAGNTATESVAFQSTVTFNSLRKNTDHYFDLALIKKRARVMEIKQGITKPELLLLAYKELEKSKLPAKLKKRLLDAIRKEITQAKRSFFASLDKMVTVQDIKPIVRDRMKEGINQLIP